MRRALVNVLVGLAVFVSCEIPTARDPHGAATLSVSPATVSVTVGQTAQLSATVQDADGNPLSGAGGASS